VRRRKHEYDALRNQEALTKAVERLYEGSFQAFMDAIALIVAETDEQLRRIYMRGVTEVLVRQQRFLEVAVAMASSLVELDPDQSHLSLLASAQLAAGNRSAARRTQRRAMNAPNRNDEPEIGRLVRARLQKRREAGKTRPRSST
jgi:hypothetical protein